MSTLSLADMKVIDEELSQLECKGTSLDKFKQILAYWKENHSVDNKELQHITNHDEKLKHLPTCHEKILKPYFNTKHEPGDRLSCYTFIYDVRLAPHDEFNDYHDPIFKMMFISISSDPQHASRYESLLNCCNSGYDYIGGGYYNMNTKRGKLSYIKYDRLESVLKSDLMDRIHDEVEFVSKHGVKIDADVNKIIHGQFTVPCDSYFSIGSNQNAYGEYEFNNETLYTKIIAFRFVNDRTSNDTYAGLINSIYKLMTKLGYSNDYLM